MWPIKIKISVVPRLAMHLKCSSFDKFFTCKIHTILCFKEQQIRYNGLKQTSKTLHGNIKECASEQGHKHPRKGTRYQK